MKKFNLLDRFGFFFGLAPAARFTLLVLLILLFLILGLSLGLLMGAWLFDVPLDGVYARSTDLNDPLAISFSKLYQLVNQLFIFMVPALVYTFITERKPWQALGISVLHKPALWVTAAFLMVVLLPLVTWLVEWNQSWRLPESFSAWEDWLIGTEQRAEELTRAFLKTENTWGLLYNLLLMAVIPALGEELLFRGVLQQLFQKWFRRDHLAILITALLFSLMHFQFYGLIPRFVLGLALGYLFYFSKSLWLPIFAHFVNNALAVMAYYFMQDKIERDGLESIGSMGSDIWAVVSMIAAVFLLYLVQRESSKDLAGKQ